MSKLKESDYIVFSLKLKHDGFIYPELFINPKFDKKTMPERPGDHFFLLLGKT